MTQTVRRRKLCALAGAAAALPVTNAASLASGGAGPLDLTDPAERLRAFMLMRGALDGRLVIGFVSGRYYGVVDSEITPLYGVIGATFSRYRATAAGYEGASYEVPYFTDLATGEVMEHYRNPYTNEDVAVPESGYPPSRFVIGPDLALTLPHPMPGLTLKQRVLPAEQYAGNVWMVEETTSTLQIAPGAKPTRYSEIVTLHALAADLRSRNARRVPCQTGFQSVVSWRPWLKMANHPGHLSANGFGAYGITMADLPPAWLKATRLRHPGVLADPAAMLAKA